MRDNCFSFSFLSAKSDSDTTACLQYLQPSPALSLNCEALLLIMKTKTDVNAVNCFLNKEFKRIKENNISLEEET